MSRRAAGRHAAAAIVFAAAGIFAPANGARAQAPGEPPDLAAGQRVAQNVCSTCHVVAANQTPPPVEGRPAPSFAAIASQPGTTADSLTRFLSTTHANPGAAAGMPNPMLTRDQIANVSAYLLSLRRAR